MDTEEAIAGIGGDPPDTGNGEWADSALLTLLKYIWFLVLGATFGL